MEKEKQYTDQITNLAFCHFYSCFAKKKKTLVEFSFFTGVELVFFVYHGLTVYASL